MGFLERLKIEQKELNERCGKLSDFIKSESFSNISQVQRSLLKQQFKAMLDYNAILVTRIELIESQNEND